MLIIVISCNQMLGLHMHILGLLFAFFPLLLHNLHVHVPCNSIIHVGSCAEQI